MLVRRCMAEVIGMLHIQFVNAVRRLQLDTSKECSCVSLDNCSVTSGCRTGYE